MADASDTGCRISRMKPISWHAQLSLVASAYAAIFLWAGLLVFQRHMQYVNQPADVMASGGMYAAGDLMLEIFIAGLFLIPTFLLVLIIRKSETAYTRYSQILLGLSLTSPICLGVFLIPAVNQGNSLLGWFCMDRLFVSPIIIFALGVSRLFANFRRAKRLTSYALLLEGGTVASIMILFLFWWTHKS
jgi:hypothetical protein